MHISLSIYIYIYIYAYIYTITTIILTQIIMRSHAYNFPPAAWSRMQLGSKLGAGLMYLFIALDLLVTHPPLGREVGRGRAVVVRGIES